MSGDMDATKMFGTPNSVFNMPSYIKAETNHLTKGSSDGASPTLAAMIERWGITAKQHYNRLSICTDVWCWPLRRGQLSHGRFNF